MKRNYTIETLREALKFSAAHIATYADGSIEHLHGHNYKVSVRLSGELDPAGMVMDVGILKQWVRTLCDGLNERFLVAMHNPLVRVEVGEDTVQLEYQATDTADRNAHGIKHYLFPREDCVLLPISNTTMEHLAHYLALRLAERLAERIKADSPDRLSEQSRITRLQVAVSETPGQSAAWTMELE